jgi:3-oxoacyl-[acyl-carrier protein] reductase
VAPGFVATEWTSQWPDERKRASVERTLMKRPCTAADIAGAIVFLWADNSPAIHHQRLRRDVSL